MCANVARGSGTSTFRRCPLADALDSPRRRTALSVVANRSDPVLESVLAVYVAAREADLDPADVSVRRRRSVRRSLHHEALPELERANLLVRDHDPARVSLPEDLPFAVTELLDRIDGLSEASWAILADLFANPDRRAVAAAAVEREAWDVSRLAEQIADCVDERDRQTVGVALRHVHLPRLAELGVLRFRPPSDRVVAPDPLPVPREWIRPDATVPSALFGRESSVPCPADHCQ